MTTLNHAIVACEQAIKADNSPVAEACRVLGNLLQGMGRFEEAVYWHTRSLEPQADRADLLAGLGKLYAQQQQWHEAIHLYQAVLQNQPDSAGAYLSLANIYAELEQFEEVAHCRCQAFRLKPDWTTPANQLELGNQLLQQQKFFAAIDCYELALQLQPDLWEAAYNLAIAQATVGNSTEAIAALQNVLQLNPTYTKAAVQLGRLLEKQGNPSEALRYYQGAIEQVAQHSDLYEAIGNLYLNQGLNTEAVQMFQAAIQANPDQIWAYHNLIESHMRQQAWEEAIQVCQSALTAGHAFPWLYTYWGRALTLQGKLAESVSWYQKGCVARGWLQCMEKNYHFTQDWFSHHIPIWQSFLQPIAHTADLKCLEVGSYQGMTACWLLDHIATHATAQLTCIDPNFQTLFHENVHKTGSADRVNILAGDSHILLPTLAPAHFDLIYVDGCHLTNHVRRNAELAWPLLKPEGILIFDDYAWQDPAYPGQDPKPGIDAFVQSRQAQIEILHQDYQLILRKESS